MKRKIILAGAAAVVLAALALTTAYFYIPGGDLPAFEDENIRVCLNDDGSMELVWPEALLTDAAALAFSSVSYHVDVLMGEKHFQKDCDSPGVLLRESSLPVEISVQVEAEGKNLLGLSRQVQGPGLNAVVESSESLNAPRVSGTPGPGTLALSWKTEGRTPDFYEVFSLEDGYFVHAATTNSQALDLKVGKTEGDLLLPSYEHPLGVNVRAGIQGEDYVLCGPASNLVVVERQDLLGDDLNLFCQEETPGIFSLNWDETRGASYGLLEWDEQEGWVLLETLKPQESFSYDLGRLGSGSRQRFQVMVWNYDGTIRTTEEVDFYATVNPMYATIWPIIDQPFYEKADAESASLGKIPGGTALCVLEEQGDWFQVRYKDQYGYVDSRFCMINLPEYIGDHCKYDIANSYSSIFKVHENPIALITEQVIPGFEHIRTEDEQFLVPYLYPCAKKLLSASLAAEADGYRLKIYEAFRPNEATRFLYDTTAGQLDLAALVYMEAVDEDGNVIETGEDGAPKRNAVDPVTGWVVDLSDGLLIDPETQEKISREDLALRQQEEAAEDSPLSEDGQEPGAVVPESPEDPASPDLSQPFFILPEEGEGGSLDPAEPQQPEPPAPQPEAPADPAPQEGEAAEGGESGESEEPEGIENPGSYFTIMTNNGRFNLGSFLARVASAHNRGIALDLTLERIDSGEELEMQSAIHDLSWYSAAYLNNENAKLLEKYMTATGMRGLSSEWWHFQDDETREAIGLTSYLFKGVNMGGWTKDDQGWRYRDTDGSFFKNTTVTVDGKRYTADQDGYVQP